MTNELKAALAAMLKRIGDKTGDRDALPQGANYEAQLTVTGTLNGRPVAEGYDAKLAVGYDSEAAAGKLPAEAILAFVLGKQNAATQEATLRDIAQEFAANDNKLPCDPTLEKRCKAALQEVRATVTGTKQGSVSGPVKRVPVADYRMVPQGEAHSNPVTA